jgi:hypothetical protein
MMRTSLAIGALAMANALNAQTHDHSSHANVTRSSSVDRLLATAREATEPYTDRKVAIAAGYRRVGGDFPSMGEHWLNPKLIVDGGFDVSRPQLLTYLMIAGRPVLTGVVYAIPLDQGESPPDALGPEALWHEHNGSIDEEGLLPEHHSAPSAKIGTRVAFVHAWIRVPGSEPVFSAENWAIPFMRLELPVPERFPNGASRALSLVSGGRDFFARLMGPASLQSARSFDECVATVTEIVRRAKSERRPLDAMELEQMDIAWTQLLRNVASRSGPEIAARINGGIAP